MMSAQSVCFKGKHVFFTSKTDNFFHLIVDSLINKAGLSPENIVAVVYPASSNIDSISRIEGIVYVSYKDNLLGGLTSAKTLTFISLLSTNSWLARSLIETSHSVADRLYIFITDDEVDRWLNVYSATGKLQPSKKLFISEDDIFVLSVVKNFICPEVYFKDKITQILERSDLQFFNCTVTFDIMDSKTSLLLNNFLSSVVQPKDETKRILIGTKPGELSRTIKILGSFSHIIKTNPVQFVIFAASYRRFIIDLYLIYREVFFRDKYDVVFISKIPPLTYNFLVASCSHLILQDRGGASTARVYLKWGRGSIFIKKESPNFFTFRDGFGVKFESFDNFGDIPYFISNEDTNLYFNARSVLQEEQRSISNLANIYC